MKNYEEPILFSNYPLEAVTGRRSDKYGSYQLFLLQIQNISYKTLVCSINLHQVDTRKRAQRKICQNVDFLCPVTAQKMKFSIY